jgi:hypothetical protein
MTKLLPALAVAICFALSAISAHAAWAVALGPTGDPIVSREMSSVSAAKQSALANCIKLFGSCEIVASANSGCAAFAISERKKWAVGDGRRNSAAREAALEGCEALRAGSCKVVHSFCGR